jgi:hypothetical protein
MMNRFILFSLMIFCTSISYSQKTLRICVNIGSGITLPRIYGEKTKPNLDKSFMVNLSFSSKLKKSLSVIYAIEYLRYKNSFVTPFNKVSIPEVNFNIRNSVTINSINTPFLIKVNFQKNFYCVSGIGLNYAFSSRRHSQAIITYDANNKKIDSEEIANEKIKLNALNTFYKAGVGKMFNLCNKKLLTEIGFWSQFNKQTFEPIKGYTDETYKFKNQMIYFSLGYFLQ